MDDIAADNAEPDVKTEQGGDPIGASDGGSKAAEEKTEAAEKPAITVEPMDVDAKPVRSWLTSQPQQSSC